MGMKIGELLSHRANISQHDIEEILHEQYHGNRPFGQIAVELGLCRSEDVWTAWTQQLSEAAQEIDLDRMGVDSQALAAMSGDVALAYHALPIREVDDVLIVATTVEDLPRGKRELPTILDREMRFVVISMDQMNRGLERYYVPLTISA